MASLVLDQLSEFGPEHCPQMSYDQASAYARKLTESQYENFTVVSWFLPRRLREPFAHIYAFCRWADDLGDETGDPQRSLELLSWWRDELDQCYRGKPRHPVFVALRKTIEEHDIPRQPFEDLIDAFVQDQTVTRYDTWEQVLDYCTRSANPVGRLVLYVAGYRDAQRQQLSDATCTALQLANFWQDVRRDILERDRVYIPEQVARKHGLDLSLMVKAVRADACKREQSVSGCNCATMPSGGVRAVLPAYRQTIAELTQRTWPMFEQGRALWPMLSPDVRLDIKLFTLGGEAILKMIRRQNYDTLTSRPSLSKPAKATLMMRALAGKIATLGRGA